MIRIAESWSSLPPHIRDAIQTLIDAATPIDQERPFALRAWELDAAAIHNAAWSMARDCRSIIQPCLREEEWRDADEEFRAIIEKGLRGLVPSSE